MPNHLQSIIPVFIPHLACPFQCIFCNQNRISATASIPDPEEVGRFIESRLHMMKGNGKKIGIGFFGGSFTGIPEVLQREYLEGAYRHLLTGDVAEIRVSTRPDLINPAKLQVLKESGVGLVELGVQSMSNEVLALCGRGHTAEDVRNAAAMLHEAGIGLGVQMMTGLPGDSPKDACNTASELIALKPVCARIYPALVLKGTPLADEYIAQKYVPQTLEEAIELCSDLLRMFITANIIVIRTGLHPSPEFNTGSLLAGPFHPAFRQLAMTRLWNKLLSGIACEDAKDITIEVNNSQLVYAIGYEAFNRVYLKKKFRRVRFLGSLQLKGLDYNVDYC